MEDKNNKRPPKKMPKKKVCMCCVDKIDDIDYKDLAKLRKFIAEKGKILPRRLSGLCSKHQRIVATAVKRARIMALLPYRSE